MRIAEPIVQTAWALLVALCAFAYGESPDKSTSSVKDLGGGWYEAVGQASVINITPEEARRRAVQSARDAALVYAVGVDVQASSLLRREEGRDGFADAFFSLSQQTHAGRVVEQRPAQWESFQIEADPAPIQVLRARVQLKVEREKGEPDPDFEVSLRLNRERYRAGEEMEMEISATRPCHLTVFCLTASDTVVVLLPHEYRTQRQVAPGDTLRLPDEREKGLGISYRVFLPPGKGRVTEAIKVVATKGEYAFGEGRQRIGGYTQIPTYRDAVDRMLRWLVRIPRDRRAETQAVYSIGP